MALQNSRRTSVVVAALCSLSMLAALLTLGTRDAHAVSVSGVVNDYYPVTGIAGSTVSVGAADARGAGGSLAVGDRVMLIQMTGIPPVQGGNFGVYETAEVTAVAGGSVTLSGITRSYDSPGAEKIQLIEMVHDAAAGVTVTAQVTAPIWNGTTGGVVAMSGSSLTNTGGIDVTGKGFSNDPDNVLGTGIGVTQATNTMFTAAHLSPPQAIRPSLVTGLGSIRLVVRAVAAAVLAAAGVSGSSTSPVLLRVVTAATTARVERRVRGPHMHRE